MSVSELPQGIWLPPRTATRFIAASNASDRSKAQADRICTGASDEDLINELLAEINALGGGKLILSEGTFVIDDPIVIPGNNIAIEGQGRSSFINGDGLATNEHGIAVLNAVNCCVKNLAIQTEDGGGKISHCIYVGGTSSYITIEGIYIIASDYSGIYIYPDDGQRDFTVRHCTVVSADNNGIEFSSTGTCYDVLITDNVVFNVCSGIYASGAERLVIHGNICINCSDYGIDGYCDYSIVSNNLIWNIDTASGKGIDWWYSSDGYIIFSNNYVHGAAGASGYGMYLAVKFSVVIGNICENNNKSGIYIYGDYNRISNNLCRSNATYGIQIESGSDKCIVQGNSLLNNTTANILDSGTLTQVFDDNEGIEITDVKMYRTVKNTSGGALAAGDVARLKAVAAGNEITTTAVLADDMVYGMIAETIANGASGYVQVKGKTTLLQASNDHGNIAIGDQLCTNDTVKECCKAAAGQTVFAWALEACAVANAQIDAYIKSPWD